MRWVIHCTSVVPSDDGNRYKEMRQRGLSFYVPGTQHPTGTAFQKSVLYGDGVDGRAGTAKKGELIQKRYLPIFTVRKEKI